MKYDEYWRFYESMTGRYREAWLPLTKCIQAACLKEALPALVASNGTRVIVSTLVPGNTRIVATSTHPPSPICQLSQSVRMPFSNDLQPIVSDHSRLGPSHTSDCLRGSKSSCPYRTVGYLLNHTSRPHAGPPHLHPGLPCWWTCTWRPHGNWTLQWCQLVFQSSPPRGGTPFRDSNPLTSPRWFCPHQTSPHKLLTCHPVRSNTFRKRTRTPKGNSAPPNSPRGWRSWRPVVGRVWLSGRTAAVEITVCCAKDPWHICSKSAKYKLQENTAPQLASKLYQTIFNDLAWIYWFNLNHKISQIYDIITPWVNWDHAKLGVLQTRILRAAENASATWQLGTFAPSSAAALAKLMSSFSGMTPWGTKSHGRWNWQFWGCSVFVTNFHKPEISLDGAPCHLHSLHKHTHIMYIYIHLCVHTYTYLYIII